jgi:Spherulation-specific family 4
LDGILKPSDHYSSENRIAAHPNVTFLVIVNPNSGPGGKPLPGYDYVREVPKLNAYANVVTVGYVRIDYCRKPLSEACDEIETYAGWTNENPALGLKGVLLDETPNHYSADRAGYLNALRQHIKATKGLGGERLVSIPAVPRMSRQA